MKIKQIAILIIGALALILVINACSKSGSTTPPAGGGSNSVTIDISGSKFPATTTVKKGTTVTWQNLDGFAHTVTSNDGTSFNSGNLANKASFSYTANTVGSFDYHCNIHAGMVGTLVVNQ